MKPKEFEYSFYYDRKPSKVHVCEKHGSFEPPEGFTPCQALHEGAKGWIPVYVPTRHIPRDCLK